MVKIKAQNKVYGPANSQLDIDENVEWACKKL